MRLKRGPSDLVAIDVASTALKVVRLKRARDGSAPTVVAAAALPPIALPAAVTGGEKPLTLAKNLVGKYVSLCVPGKSAIVKILTFMGKMEDTSESQILQLMGIEKPEEYRISYKTITSSSGRQQESKVLTVALPEPEAHAVLKLFPSGLPATYSLEVSGLATMTAYFHGPGVEHGGDAVGVIDFGAEVTFFALFNKNVLSLIRKFDVGSGAIIAKVQKSLGVDRDTALGIVSDGSFDLSQTINETMEPFVKQLVISRDFVERRENCRVAHIFAVGGMTASRDWMKEMRTGLGLEVETWNPFEKLTILPGAIPDNLKGRESQFASAIGAALASFEAP